jgi:hypothetical protein
MTAHTLNYRRDRKVAPCQQERHNGKVLLEDSRR